MRSKTAGTGENLQTSPRIFTKYGENAENGHRVGTFHSGLCSRRHAQRMTDGSGWTTGGPVTACARDL